LIPRSIQANHIQPEIGPFLHGEKTRQLPLVTGQPQVAYFIIVEGESSFPIPKMSVSQPAFNRTARGPPTTRRRIRRKKQNLSQNQANRVGQYSAQINKQPAKPVHMSYHRR